MRFTFLEVGVFCQEMIKKESKWRDVGCYKYLPLEEVSNDGLKYKYYHVENSPFLAVIFQALNEKPSYNYIGRLAHIPISRLYNYILPFLDTLKSKGIENIF